jgi:glycosyltransferase involved in cell wall biosynthesis
MKVKVLEAIASGVPVVTTEPGAEGLSTSDGVVIRDSDAALADEVAELLADRSARLQRGAAGRQLFLDEYAPLPATAPLIPLYARMAGT